MELLMSIVVGLFFAIATYLMLSRRLLRIVLGTAVLTHGVHLLLITMGGLKRGAAPFVGAGTPGYADPLPQALILTSIVINFGISAFLLVLLYRAYKELGTDDIDTYRGLAEDE